MHTIDDNKNALYCLYVQPKAIGMIDAHERQQVRLAIEAAENCTRPRWWLARYGGLVACRGADAAEINKEYNQHRKRIADSVKPVRALGAW